MSSSSLVIRNGTIVDGSGGDPYEADLLAINGRIAAIGDSIPKGTEEIDARGKLVTPGFVDVHTHYDAQVTWSDRLSPSSWNGATTVLFGNCGVGFAPCHEDQHDMLINLMEGVEDIPEVVLSEGLPWNWHSFPDFLDAVAARSYDADVAAQVPHAALRVYVMGQRGADREPATEQDRRRMAELTAEGLRAGALGFSTSRTLNHRSADGRHIPTLRAEEAELTAIAHAMRETGAGWLQIVSDFKDQTGEIELFRRLARESGRPVTITLIQSDARPEGWRELMAQIDEANDEGLRITAQVRPRPTSVLLGLELSQNAFTGRPSYKRIAHLPFAERLALLRQPERGRRQRDVVPARHQLCRRQSRRGAGHDRCAEFPDWPRRWRGPRRHHVRRHFDQLSADALDARSTAGCSLPGVLGDQATGGGQCRGDRAERSRLAAGRHEGRYQYSGLRQSLSPPARDRLRPAGGR